MRNEWVNASQNDNEASTANFDIQKWICSCNQYQSSTFYLCNHLVKTVNFEPRFYSQIVFRDNYPFISFDNEDGAVTSPLIQSADSIIISNPQADIQSHDESCENLYLKLNSLIKFLDTDLQKNRYNLKQLEVLSHCLADGYKYKNSVDGYNELKKLPQTWNDLDKYNMFY